MKETYSRPTVTNADIENKNVELAPALALMGAYVVGRAVTKAADARPSIKLPALPRSKS